MLYLLKQVQNKATQNVAYIQFLKLKKGINESVGRKLYSGNFPAWTITIKESFLRI